MTVVAFDAAACIGVIVFVVAVMLDRLVDSVFDTRTPEAETFAAFAIRSALAAFGAARAWPDRGAEAGVLVTAGRSLAAGLAVTSDACWLWRALPQCYRGTDVGVARRNRA